MQLFQKKKILLQFVSTFLKGSLNFEYFPKKVLVIADIFLKLQNLKYVVK